MNLVANRSLFRKRDCSKSLVQRFSNSIFEPIWNRNYVSCVQITVSEDLGVGSRGGYYDKSGALRDMMQNHVMQLLALTAMEPPSSLDAEAIRDEKVKALKAIKQIDVNGENAEVVRGVYEEGLVGKRKGYLEEEGIPEDSITETMQPMLEYRKLAMEGVPFI